MNNRIVKMHADEADIDGALVGRLIADQFPQWADLPLEGVRSAGTDNAIYRLGDDMAVRLPRISWAAGQVEKEWQWLPRLAAHLPLAIAMPLAKGEPAESYPWNWGIYRWREGENATRERIADIHEMARTLARFVTALQQIDTRGGPVAGTHNSGRGVSLTLRDAPTREAILALGDQIDGVAALLAWETALQAPEWRGAPVWVHGDIQSGNLLIINGQLSAVIDFGCLGVGDPAVDLIVAWNLLTPEARRSFREALPQVDTATWVRGRGWALSTALIALPYYKDTNPTLAEIARYTIAAVLTE